MNRSLKEALSLILFLTAISVQLCQAYPEPSSSKNEEIAEEFAADVQTLSQIEEENKDQISEGDLKRQSRKVPCPFHKLKSGITKAAAIPCGAAAGAAAAAITGKSVGSSIGETSIGGSIGGTSVGEATLRGGSFGGADITGVGGGISFDHLANGFDIISERAVQIAASLEGAISGLQELGVQMSHVLGNLRTEVETVNVPVELRYDVVQTCDDYAQAEKGISGIINHIYRFFKLPPSKGGQVQVRNNVEIGSCLDKIKANLMSFLATIRSWFSCDKLFSSNKGISKFQSYINSIPSSSQCSILNGLGKSPGNYVLVPHENGHYAVGGSGGFSASGGGQINTAHMEQQLGEMKQVIGVLRNLEPMINTFMEGLREYSLQYVNQRAYAAQRAQAEVRTIQVPVAPVYQVPIYPSALRSGNVMHLTPSVSGQSFVKINQRVSDIPAATSTFYIKPAQQASVPAPLLCSGQSLVDNIYSAVSTSPVIKHTDSHRISSTVGNMNSGRSALDLLNVKINLSRDTVYALLKGQVPAAGDIIILNLTDDMMIIGSPSDDISPITFNIIYRGISSSTRYNNNVLIWNLSEDDFSCNQNIFNDVLGHLVYSL